MDRNKKIVKVSIQGILVNILLVIFKSIVGFLANSISIILDAVNNLTDVLSSVITIIGTKIASKKPDKKHPYGHGRAEYFASVIISIIVLFAGILAFNESITKILKGDTATYNLVSLIIIFVAIFVKYFFGKYLKKVGKSLTSSSLEASGIDAISDAALSLSTFVGALINYIWHINLEGYIAAIISIMIVKTALGILKNTIDQMIGVRASKELTSKLKKLIYTYDDVLGVYDLTLHNYGPNNIIGTVHIEVNDKMTARKIHALTRNITMDIYNALGIVITIGIYSSSDSKYDNIKKYILSLSKEYNILQVHAFYVDESIKLVSFDLVFDFDLADPEKAKDEIVEKLKDKFKDYNYMVIIDKDYSD